MYLFQYMCWDKCLDTEWCTCFILKKCIMDRSITIVYKSDFTTAPMDEALDLQVQTKGNNYTTSTPY